MKVSEHVEMKTKGTKKVGIGMTLFGVAAEVASLFVKDKEAKEGLSDIGLMCGVAGIGVSVAAAPVARSEAKDLLQKGLLEPDDSQIPHVPNILPKPRAV